MYGNRGLITWEFREKRKQDPAPKSSEEGKSLSVYSEVRFGKRIKDMGYA